MTSNVVIFFLLLVGGYYLYIVTDMVHNVHPTYPEPETIFNSNPSFLEIEEMAKFQAKRVNQHNQYEMAHGFVPADKLNLTQTKCLVPTNVTILRDWWNHNTLIELAHKTGRPKYLTYEFCNGNYTPMCNVLRTCHMEKEYDGLYVASKFCNLMSPRADPTLKILNKTKARWNETSQRMEVILRVVITLPNGNPISATDSLIIVRDNSDGWYKCNFTVLSSSEILFQYTNQSGYTPVHEEVTFECSHRGHRFPCILKEWVYEKSRCGVQVTWNWNNSKVDDPSTSLWMLRHPAYRPTWYHESVELILDELN